MANNPNALILQQTDASILGFSNRWYADAFRYAKPIALPGGKSIRLITSPYFLATKLEAFDDRGNNDFMVSHDIEDIVVVIDGREEVVQDIEYAKQDVRGYLSTRVASLLANTAFIDAIPAHLPPDSASQARRNIVMKRLVDIAGMV